MRISKSLRCLIPILSLAFSFQARSEDLNLQALDQKRIGWIVRAFNQKPESLVELLTNESVKIHDGVGRVDVNKKAKFSYYIQTENPQSAESDIYLLPMATSRFAPTYYQTDEWWDAHKNEKPMPRQPMEEVTNWLQQMKLSTNPDILILKPGRGQLQRQPLQSFLLDVYLKRYARNGLITLYRGAEREGETRTWEQGARPSGARYWTPTANYAWRYARKNLNFIEELVKGQAPLLKFEVPVEQFKAMVKREWPQLTLGTELTKRVHDNFDHTGRFVDHISDGDPYMGEGSFGVEFEIRANRTGSDLMARYYKGPISIEELAQDRIRVIRDATARLQAQRPQESVALEKRADARVQTIQNEARLLLLLKNEAPKEQIQPVLEKLGSNREITRIDGFYLSNFVQQKRQASTGEQKFDLEKIIRTSVQSLKSCRMVHL